MSPSRRSLDTKYHGLINQGSTCYLNSVLQVLFMTKDFRKAVTTASESHPDENPCIDIELTNLFTALESNTARTTDVTKKLGIERVYEQSDAAEYFEKILRLASADASQIFQGSLVHATECSKCGTTSDEPAPFWDLPLALKNSHGEAYRVVHGIQDFFKVSEFVGDNQLYCDECCAKQDAAGRYQIKQHPEVLMLLLKRFEFSYHQMSFVKNSCDVIVPHMLTIPENQTYEMYAFVEHFGSLRGGHYTATIKSQDEDRWYEFNDSTVTPLHKQPFQNRTTEKSNTAYLLFYRKKSLGSVDNRDVSGAEVLPPDTNKNYHQPQAKKRKTRDENLEIQKRSNAREEGSDEEASNKGAQSKWTGPYGDQDDSRERKGVRGSHDAEARQKPKYEEGVGGEAEGEYAEMTEDELRAREKRKIPAKKDKEGKNGQKEKQHAGRIEGKKENTEAEGLASTNFRELERHDSRKDTEGKKSVSSGEQNMQKNPLACKEETGSSKQTKEVRMRMLREENKPKMQVNNQSQRAKTSEMRDHVDEDREGRVDDALITKENRAKNQVIKNHDEITEEPLPLQKGPEVKRMEEQEATGSKNKKRGWLKRFFRLFKNKKSKKNTGDENTERKKKSDEQEQADEKKRSKASQKKQSPKLQNKKSDPGKGNQCVGCLPSLTNKTADSYDQYV